MTTPVPATWIRGAGRLTAAFALVGVMTAVAPAASSGIGEFVSFQARSQHLAAQIRTIDLSGAPVATVVPSEYAGGFLERIGGLAVTDEGIWVVDWGQTTVLRFSEAGELIAQYGREGGGPGEYQSIERIRVDSLLTIQDPMQGREVRFRLDGTHFDTRPVRRLKDNHGALRPARSWAMLNNGVLVRQYRPTFVWPPLENQEYLQHVVLAYPGSQELDTIASYHSGSSNWSIPDQEGGLLRTPFGEAGAWDVVGDTAIVVAHGVAATLTFVTPTDDSFRADTFQLGLEAPAVGDRDVAEARADGDVPRRAVLFDVPEYWSVATDLLLGEDGEYWLRQAVDDDREHWMVVIPGVVEMVRAVFPERFSLKAVHGGRLYGVATDELDVPSVGAFVDPRDSLP